MNQPISDVLADLDCPLTDEQRIAAADKLDEMELRIKDLELENMCLQTQVDQQKEEIGQQKEQILLAAAESQEALINIRMH